MGRCFIFGAGDFYGLAEKPEPPDFLIAADGGFLLCRKLGLTPDLLVGDFDSMEAPPFPHILRCPVEKDDTDTLLAVKEGLRRGYGEFHLYGGTGGRRPDHTMANYQTLLYLCRRGARGYLYDRRMAWTALENGTIQIPCGVDGGVVSVFALDGTAEGVTLSGLYYPLTDGTLTPAFPLGVGNHFTAETASVTVRRGALLVGWELPEAEAVGSRIEASFPDR